MDSALATDSTYGGGGDSQTDTTAGNNTVLLGNRQPAVGAIRRGHPPGTDLEQVRQVWGVTSSLEPCRQRLTSAAFHDYGGWPTWVGTKPAPPHAA
jgi:hypothetical protein